MAHRYDEADGAAAFGVSNVNPLMVACVHASLSIFAEAGGVRKLRRKSILLTGYLEALLKQRGLLASTQKKGAGRASTALLEIVTPSDPARRGCQLSLRVKPASPAASGGKVLTMRALEEALRDRGVVGDAREPDIVRISPVPLYNTFTDVFRAVEALQDALRAA